MNGATLAATNAGGTSYGNYIFSGSLTVGGTAASLISADIRCGSNATHTLNIGETGEDVDLLISGKLGHYNGFSWGYANKTGPGTLKITGTNNLGGMTVSEGTVILEGASAIASMDMTSLTNNAAVILSVPTGTVSYPRALLGNGLYTKTGAGTLELTSTTAHAGNHLVQEGVLRLTQASLGNASTITLNAGAQINLAFTGRDTIGALVIDGVTLPPGIYSAATHPAYLTGTGSLKVAAPAILAWNNSAGTGLWNASDTNWTGQSWVPKADAIIAHTATAQTITVSGNPTALDVLIGNGSNNANYTLLGGPGATLAADLFTVQGTASNNPGTRHDHPQQPGRQPHRRSRRRPLGSRHRRHQQPPNRRTTPLHQQRRRHRRLGPRHAPGHRQRHRHRRRQRRRRGLGTHPEWRHAHHPEHPRGGKHLRRGRAAHAERHDPRRHPGHRQFPHRRWHQPGLRRLERRALRHQRQKHHRRGETRRCFRPGRLAHQTRLRHADADQRR